MTNERTAVLAKAQELLREQRGGLPVFVRPPTRGPEHYSGISRAKLYQLAGDGRIRTVSIKERGKLRGCRLFDLASILRYIESCSCSEGSPGTATTTTTTGAAATE